MTKLNQQVIAILLSKGQQHLADVWGVTVQEASRRINGERGMKIEEFAAALESLGVQFVTAESVVLSRSKYQALRELAKEALEQGE